MRIFAEPALGAARGRCLQRVVRPMVLGVAAAHILAYLDIAAAPETGQIAGDLHRALGRRQQLERHRYCAVADARGFYKAEDFLQKVNALCGSTDCKEYIELKAVIDGKASY